MEARERRAKSNIIVSVLGRFVTAICGLVVSKLLIQTYGSEAYGATDSIAKFLAYIFVLDGGVSGVARAALYKPLAMNDERKINELMYKMQRFFRVLAIIFAVYVPVIACTFKQFSHLECMDWISTFMLVIVISISTFIEYLAFSYIILVNAAQKTYIDQTITIVTTFINAVLVAVLVNCGSGLVLVKFITSLVIAARPVIMWLYAKRHYNLTRPSGEPHGEPSTEPDLLDQKWVGLAQHIAYVLHKNTDVVVLTFFGDLKLVAVYAVYFMVISGIETLTLSFSSGMEARFGERLAKKEYDTLDKTFSRYESLISVVAGVLFSVTAVMIVPFVRIYTKEITDVDYIYPAFALLLTLASYLFCIRMPYHALVTASGSFRLTQIASYGEAALNIILSVVLVIKFGIVGVAIGTVAAVSFRFIYYVVFLSREVAQRKVGLFIVRMAGNILPFGIVLLLGYNVISRFDLTGYIGWGLAAITVTAMSVVIWFAVEYVLRRIVMKETVR